MRRECHRGKKSLVTSLECLSFTVQNDVQSLTLQGCFHIHLLSVMWKLEASRFSNTENGLFIEGVKLLK